VIGIVASRLVEKFCRPTILISLNGEIDNYRALRQWFGQTLANCVRPRKKLLSQRFADHNRRGKLHHGLGPCFG
jgi:single-stranded DNA-specific DHH superfamily exonuclease